MFRKVNGLEHIKDGSSWANIIILWKQQFLLLLNINKNGVEMDIIKDKSNTTDDNLIIEGIQDFLKKKKKIFNGEDEDSFKLSYSNHNCCYNEYKNKSYYVREISDLIKNGNMASFKLEVSRIQLTAVIQIIAEVIAGRAFSCEFNKYTINDIRALQDALGKLWTAGNYNGSIQKVISFH